MLTATNYKYRNYTNSKVACFISVDPLQFKYPIQNPYTYADNRPVSMIDLDGAGARVTYWVDANGVTHAVVSANIYVYTDDNSDIDVNSFAESYEDNLNSIFNSSNEGNPYIYVYKPGKDVNGDQTKRGGTRERAQVTYQFNVIPVSQEKAKTLADNNNGNKENNFFYVNDEGRNRSTGGNSGALSINKHSTQHVHELIHMLGWSKFPYGINGKYGGDHADYINEKQSIMWIGKIEINRFDEFSVSGLPDIDITRLNYNTPISTMNKLTGMEYIEQGLANTIEYSTEIHSTTIGADPLDLIYTSDSAEGSIDLLIINKNRTNRTNAYEKQ